MSYHTLELDAKIVINGVEFPFTAVIGGQATRGAAYDLCFEEDLMLSDIIGCYELNEHFSYLILEDREKFMSDTQYDQMADDKLFDGE